MTRCKVLIADPPWQFGDSLPGPKRGAGKHYKTMSLEEIQLFNLPPMDFNAVLFLWRVSAMVEDAYIVLNSWGFVPKAELVWVKATGAPNTRRLQMGMGHYTRGAHETCIIAVKGAGIEPASHSERSVFFAPRTEHSTKPEEFYQIVERMYPMSVPFEYDHVELFARRKRPGWVTLGDEV